MATETPKKKRGPASLTDEHKAAMAEGRAQGRAVRNYLEAVEAHGSLKGSYLGIRRILRCHPWGGCGYDTVPSTEDPKSSSQNSPTH